MTKQNLGSIEIDDGFEGIIYNAKSFPEFAYFDAVKSLGLGLSEHRTCIYLKGEKLKVLYRSFEDTRFPNRHHSGLNEMMKKN
ncbi:hypothetical protein HYS72_00615 [Candidatus Pacearchaeota archaeon]|nr:hypothetical protein [Candidatus Pacearchaeota archaeon]MBI2057308.1 hypothetical protein [Candidatus Pacearchaeota archaeon]